MLEQIRREVSDDGSLSKFIADLHADIKSHNWNKNHKVFVYLSVNRVNWKLMKFRKFEHVLFCH